MAQGRRDSTSALTPQRHILTVPFTTRAAYRAALFYSSSVPSNAKSILLAPFLRTQLFSAAIANQYLKAKYFASKYLEGYLFPMVKFKMLWQHNTSQQRSPNLETALDLDSKFDSCACAKCKKRVVSHSSPLMDPDQAAAYLGVEPTTLAIWRSTKRYPLRYIKVGRHVRYRKSDLDAFLDKRTITSMP